MSDWRKAPDWLVQVFDGVVPDGAERRKMFGYPCAFLDGNMYIGLHQENFIVRLAEEDRERARTELGVGPFEPSPGRTMKEYVALPEQVVRDPALLGEWVDRAHRFASSLPPKPPKQKRAET